jgi:hypothetical protein
MTKPATARTDAIAESLPYQDDRGHALAEFLKNELTACVTLVNHAIAMKKAGNQDLENQAIANSEKCYATLRPFLTDSTRSQELKAEELKEFSAQLELLRNALDCLEKFRRTELLAYELWRQRGSPPGTPQEDWFRAEQLVAKS